ALKVLPPHVTLDPRAVERFQREARAAARLHHPGIVEIHAVGEVAGTHFFAMELVDGVPLDVVVARMRERAGGPTAQDEKHIESAVRLVARVADALQCAHEQGVIHRDVKPSNVLVRPDGTPTLMDFGIARDRGLPSLTQTGEFAGTPYYVSPEQA